MDTKKLCVFPNDPINAYYLKGEIRERYFNPNNFFEEIHIIVFEDEDIEEEKIKEIAGNAKLKIHCMGKINFKNRNQIKKNIIKIISEINPNVLRAYNIRLEGWMAAYCSKKLNIPFLLSIHTENQQKRKWMKKKNLKKFLILKIFENKIEPFVIKQAKKIILIYSSLEPYIKKKGGKNLEVLYNSIDLDKFSNGKRVETLPKPLIISVGNLSDVKNHQCIIKSMKEINANLLIIGKGEKEKELKKIIKNLRIENKVIMIPNVKYSEIENYYKSADIFALAFDPKLETMPKPVIEAMASGLPVIIPVIEKKFSEGLENYTVFAKREPKEFAEKINMILKDKKMLEKFSALSVEKAKEFDSKILEQKESSIYSKLINEANMDNDFKN